MSIWVWIVVVAVCYLLGSVNFGVVLSRLAASDDVRLHGSKSTGATNMLRTYGKLAGFLTLFLDMSKGIIAACVCLYFKSDWLLFAGGLAVVCGHNWPIFHKFKGGKGAATALGLALIASPWLTLAGAVVVVLVAVITKYMSLATLTGIAFIVVMFYIFEPTAYFALGVCLFALSVFKHRTNIKRLISGTENKLNFSKKKD